LLPGEAGAIDQGRGSDPGATEDMNPKTLKLIALGYVVKTALVGLAWLAIPDLPERAVAMARHTWSRVTSETPNR
jgi:hypothetical protein